MYAIVTSNLSALNQFSHSQTFSAEKGEPGGKNRKFGSDGGDLEIQFPLGTSLIDVTSGEEIELTSTDQRIRLCKGGLGGRGNYEFKSSRRTTPTYAQPGLEGDIREFHVILKLIADFGLIGLPNAGKSSLLNEMTRANARVAAYPFTTLEPNLGVLGDVKGEGKILADIPGLIEGASDGKGLGFKFLKHIEKVNALLHCISAESEDPMGDYQVVKKELGEFNAELLDKKEIILLTKTDLVSAETVKEKIKAVKKLKLEVLPVSVHDYESLEKLKQVLLS